MGVGLGIKIDLRDSEKMQQQIVLASTIAEGKSVVSDTEGPPSPTALSVVSGESMDTIGMSKDSNLNAALRGIVDERLKGLINDSSTSRVSYNEKVGLMIVEIVDKVTGKVIGTLPEDGFVELRERLIAMNSSVGIFLNKRG